MIEIVWKEIDQKYGPPVHGATVGKIRVGSVGYALRSRGEPEAYTYVCDLPSLKDAFSRGQKPSVDEAKTALESVVRRWFFFAIGESS